jgi:hypothetical protein
MKAEHLWKLSLGIAMAALPLAGRADQEPTTTNTTAVADTNPPAPVLPLITNVPLPGAAEQELENAPAQVVSAPTTSPPNLVLPPPVLDVAKLAQAGVDESVIMSFVTNSPNTFNLDSDAIVYLSDLGVPGAVVTAMIQHDQTLKANAELAAGPALYANPPVPAEDASASYPTNEFQTDLASYSATPDQVPAEQTIEETAPPVSSVSYNYFYSSLAPYGSWISVGGYGPCWRPTACLLNAGWQPYCNNGHWVYTDCGWYWASDYTWGWAPFHYGRWFHTYHYGWCWAPDTVWSPAWVSWRHTPHYCGWAPLPPSACYSPGVGFTYYGHSVGVGFNFGLQSSSFVFVPTSRFNDPHPYQYRVPPASAKPIFAQSVVFNHYVEGRNHVVMNKGIPVERITTATHREIRPVQLRDAPGPGKVLHNPLDQRGGTLAVYRPGLPPPAKGTVLVGETFGSRLSKPAVPFPGSARTHGVAFSHPLTAANPTPVAVGVKASPVYQTRQPTWGASPVRWTETRPAAPAHGMGSAGAVPTPVVATPVPNNTPVHPQTRIQPPQPYHAATPVQWHPGGGKTEQPVRPAVQPQVPQSTYPWTYRSQPAWNNQPAAGHAAPVYHAAPQAPAAPSGQTFQSVPARTAPSAQRNSYNASPSPAPQQSWGARQNH